MTHRLLRIFLTAVVSVAGLSFLPGSFSAASPAASVFAKDSKPAPYALMFGTVYGPDDRPRQGVVVKIRPASAKKVKWERLSDSHGEFAQRVPAGVNDYVVWADLKNRQAAEKTKVTVHIDNDERRDISLHLPE
jgi:hypothetical protein